MIPRHKPLSRSRPRRFRKGLRRGELTPEQKQAIREKRYRFDGGRCVDCGKRVILLRGYWCSMHLMHLKSRGAGGTWDLENLRTGCQWCHVKRHNAGGKPCPPKPKMEEL